MHPDHHHAHPKVAAPPGEYYLVIPAISTIPNGKQEGPLRTSGYSFAPGANTERSFDQVFTAVDHDASTEGCKKHLRCVARRPSILPAGVLAHGLVHTTVSPSDLKANVCYISTMATFVKKNNIAFGALTFMLHRLRQALSSTLDKQRCHALVDALEVAWESIWGGKAGCVVQRVWVEGPLPQGALRGLDEHQHGHHVTMNRSKHHSGSWSGQNSRSASAHHRATPQQHRLRLSSSASGRRPHRPHSGRETGEGRTTGGVAPGMQGPWAAWSAGREWGFLELDAAAIDAFLGVAGAMTLHDASGATLIGEKFRSMAVHRICAAVESSCGQALRRGPLAMAESGVQSEAGLASCLAFVALRSPADDSESWQGQAPATTEAGPSSETLRSVSLLAIPEVVAVLETHLRALRLSRKLPLSSPHTGPLPGVSPEMAPMAPPSHLIAPGRSPAGGPLAAPGLSPFLGSSLATQPPPPVLPTAEGEGMLGPSMSTTPLPYGSGSEVISFSSAVVEPRLYVHRSVRDVICGPDDTLLRWIPAVEMPMPTEDGSHGGDMVGEKRGKRSTNQWRRSDSSGSTTPGRPRHRADADDVDTSDTYSDRSTDDEADLDPSGMLAAGADPEEVSAALRSKVVRHADVVVPLWRLDQLGQQRGGAKKPKSRASTTVPPTSPFEEPLMVKPVALRVKRQK